ncbi:MAG: NAD(P)/FAD-dependent oxidoreductase [Clostridiales bacterium]|nr:NAD(P)/FAD-dependent oxidoreductase [Clostridiales bacterium]
MKDYVIIGNSIAAVGCIEGIRKIDKDGSILVIGNENHFVYGRPLISYMLMGKTSLDKMNYRDENFYDVNKVETKLGVEVVSIDKDAKAVKLSTGDVIEYKKLMLATGSRPFLPPMKGIELVEKRTSFMSIDDALKLDKMISKDEDVLIIGAGLIGLKCVEGILDKVKSITVVDLANRVLPSILDEKGSELVKKYLESKGVKFILGESIGEFTSSTTATTTTGKELTFGTLVTAVGVKPNTSLLQDIGGKVNRGIVVDQNGKTSIDDIYAGGDCVESIDISCDTQRILAILPNAYFQGRSAGISMAGGDEPFDKAMPMNSIGFFDLHIITAGSYIGDKDVVLDDEDNYKVLFTKDNLLVGFILIGDVKRAGIYTNLIRNKTPLDTIDYSLIRTNPQLMAFSYKHRQEQLGRAH